MTFSSLYLCQWPHGELVRAAYLAPLRTLWRSGRPEAASIFDLRPNPYIKLPGACESEFAWCDDLAKRPGREGTFTEEIPWWAYTKQHDWTQDVWLAASSQTNFTENCAFQGVQKRIE